MIRIPYIVLLTGMILLSSLIHGQTDTSSGEEISLEFIKKK